MTEVKRDLALTQFFSIWEWFFFATKAIHVMIKTYSLHFFSANFMNIIFQMKRQNFKMYFFHK